MPPRHFTVSRAVNILLMVSALQSLNGSASAQETREHGAYSVEMGQTRKGDSCKLVIAYAAGGKVFHLSMSHEFGMMFRNLYITTFDELRGEAASVQIDGRELMRFETQNAEPAGLIVAAHVEMTDERVLRELKVAAKDPQRLEVVAGDFRLSIPIKGFQQAADDYVACRQDRWL